MQIIKPEMGSGKSHICSQLVGSTGDLEISKLMASVRSVGNHAGEPLTCEDSANPQ